MAAMRIRPAAMSIAHASTCFRQPRLIELQYLRILRYRDALGEQYGARSQEPDLFVDVNLPRSTPKQLPDFCRLWKAVEDQNGVVYLDLEEGSAFRPDEFTFIRTALEKAGAKVLNAFYDDGAAFQKALNDRWGEEASPDQVDDASDFHYLLPLADQRSYCQGKVSRYTMFRSFEVLTGPW